MPQEDASFDTVRTALENLPYLRHVEIQGEGEPLLHPRFMEMVRLARGRDVEVSFITNGSLLAPAVVDRLLDADVAKISVSIESADPEQFRSIRGGILEKVTRNLEHLIHERSRRGLERPVVGLSVTVLQQTKDRLPGILALYRRLGLDGGITLNPLQKMKTYFRHYDEAMQREVLSEDESADVWLRFISDSAVRKIQSSRGATRGFYDELMDGWRPSQRTCPWLERGLYVHRDGQATACCMVKDTARYSLGRIGVDDPTQVLERRERMRAQLAAGETPEACSGCELVRMALMPRSRLLRFGLKGVWNRWFRPSSRAIDVA
jgi:MoaA/NifB/PqqE/SkfB family radical SAM enzyme